MGLISLLANHTGPINSSLFRECHPPINPSHYFVTGEQLLSRRSVLGSLLVDISLGVVAGLVELVSNSILCGGGAAGEGCVAVLGDRLG